MKLSAFARTILFEPSLDAKLIKATDFEIDHSGEKKSVFKTPDAPARSDGLSLRARDKTQKVPFPTASELGDPRQRGIVLHFFANHELLAMELMALAILKFPDAPPAFLIGIAKTIQEEQTHLQLYLNRMREFGVQFGDVPVNRFFWDCIANMHTPMDYVTRMSMTLEQANLDFSLHYRNIFAGLGDEPTTAILERVYQEEIGHVKHGVIWFERWRNQDIPQWDDFLARMQTPMAASRAKGIGFDRDGRLKAGLSPTFIDELAVYKHSKGRPPIVYFFNPACEEEVSNPMTSFNPNQAIADITHDLASLMLFVAAEDDVVLCPEKPSTSFLTQLQAAGIKIPQFIQSDANGPVPALKDRLIDHVEPWGQSPSALRRIGAMRLNAARVLKSLSNPKLFAKDWSADLARKVAPQQVPSQIFSDMTLIKQYTDAHFATSTQPLVIKAPLGTSGRNMQRLQAPGITENQSRWLEKLLQSQGRVLIEPWFNKVADLSVQLQVGAAKPVLGITRFLTNPNGQYSGHRLGRKWEDLPAEYLRIIYGEKFHEQLIAVGEHIAGALAAEGYTGAAGIDSLIYQDQGSLKLRPVVEINCRFTMGRIAFEVDRSIHHASPALWLHLTKKQIAAGGFKTFQEFNNELSKRFPLQLKNKLLCAGFMSTTDPHLARQILSCLFIGSEAVEAAQVFL